MPDKPTIAVFGSGACSPGEPLWETAFDVGRQIAQAGWRLINGGYGGTMEASAKGASEAGGGVWGVTCEVFGRAGANRYIKKVVDTKELKERLFTLVELADAFIILPGSTGTLLELASVWEYNNKSLFEKNKPVILLGDYWRTVVDFVCSESPQTGTALLGASNPAQAVKLLIDSGIKT
ncbi:LOG family protein ORF6 in fasciation locus [Limihaloglobus sulfuriphilus]|uniref:LOG family protein ORF6 in fasciation locus n=1 Tax=Limihaloglobus sulfuriphilus TaxID=1851148 RepID=A0A1Q2MBW4_9BACT|nr:LOG family protein [Limihaloglobus sulfuriphilus]AQQ69732.1 LOG family protein ORF6 in fasciation locus [Limihaloglobus sulfuriphilus]